ncbi:DUF4185 domain-containing protein [Pedobacter sp. SYP-B3415]|uniref:DUF4185 domain-containing protein n=1 Tax=Pedobacter sp. SYP-B3415 TaxID=2496641 RepID=UPI00101B9E27|nr:DUF4185 domain-containing protein [Pedobacter sp. SYP-B3415]
MHRLVTYVFLLMTVFSSTELRAGQSDTIRVTRISRVTGNSINGERFPNPNNTAARFDLGGTDLGIAWRMGDGKVGLWFGDSYGTEFFPVPEGGPGKAGNWRSNLLAFSSDSGLEDGLHIDDMFSSPGKKGAAEVIFSPHTTDGKGSHTTIPTAAIHAAGKEYVQYMDVRKWLGPGRWITNFSGLYTSANLGRTWERVRNFTFNAGSNFAQGGFAVKGDYIYTLATPAGRWGRIRLARVKQKNFASKAHWAYWNKEKGWVTNREDEATDLFDAPAGELSVIWHPHLRCWLLTYLNEKRHALVLRRASALTGPWSAEQVLADARRYPGLYGAFIHPQLDKHGFYFLMSMWKPYNVFLMRAELRAVPKS